VTSIALPIVIEYEEKTGRILIDESEAPFDGNPVLIQIGNGWVEAWWCKSEPSYNHEYGIEEDDGFMWVCLDDKFHEELEAAKFWLPLPFIITEGEKAVAENKEFPAAVIASLASGISLCKFDELHEAAEYLMGHPILTHHFASKDLWQAMQKTILAQCPDMPTEITGVTPENYKAKIAEIEAKVGVTVKISKGDGKTAMHPLQGIPEGKPVTILQKQEDE
jgi:hypothetical protein